MQQLNLKPWNPVALSYQKTINKRAWTGEVSSAVDMHRETLNKPKNWRKPRMASVCTKMDLFDPDVTDEQIYHIWCEMQCARDHIFVLKTKHPERMKQWLSEVWAQSWRANTGVALENLWLGVSAQDQQTADDRIPLLLETPAAVRFLSCEPLLGEINLKRINASGMVIDALTGAYFPAGGGAGGAWAGGQGNKLDWVIVGGESGAKARPCDIAWIRSIVRQCQKALVPVNVEQLGSKPTFSEADYPDYFPLHCIEAPKANDPDEWPEDLRVRQVPTVWAKNQEKTNATT